MEFLKAMRSLGKPPKAKHRDSHPQNTPPLENNTPVQSSVQEEEQEEDEDVISDEIKRRLKELRRGNFMVLIPEESCPDEEREEGSSSSGWREGSEGVDDDAYPSWVGFEDLHAKYCERMLFFDKILAQKLACSESQEELTNPRRTAGRRRGLFSFKRQPSPDADDSPRLLQSPGEDGEDQQQSLETAYVAQVSLTWEALHWQYGQLKHRLSSSSSSSSPSSSPFYSMAVQRLQQFQVLLQRFSEDEPFQRATRAEHYCRSRLAMPNLLQLPSLQGLGEYEEEDEETWSPLSSASSTPPVGPADVMEAMEAAVLAFRRFVKTEKKRSPPGRRNRLVGQQKGYADSLLQVQKSLEKKEMKLKELLRRRKTKKKRTGTTETEGAWPGTEGEVEILFGLMDMRVLSRVLAMGRLSKEHLLWCEEKMSKLHLSHLAFHRDPSPVLFPC